MEPITRKEKIIAGEKLTPITREEMFLTQYGGGGGGGSFVMRLSADEMTLGDEIMCTTNYDELAKALEAGGRVNIVLPGEVLGSGSPAVNMSVLAWSYMEGTGLVCYCSTYGNPIPFIFTNGTYVPKI